MKPARKPARVPAAAALPILRPESPAAIPVRTRLDLYVEQRDRSAAHAYTRVGVGGAK